MRVLRQAIHRAIAPPVLVAPAEACVLPLSPFTSVHLRTRDLNVVSFWVAILLQWGHALALAAQSKWRRRTAAPRRTLHVYER